MRFRPFPLALLLACTVLATTAVVSPTSSQAAVVPWGTVLVPGSQWAGSYASVGNLNVYSNGDGNEDQVTLTGTAYECVELAQRWAYTAFGEQRLWPVAAAYQMWNVAPSLKVPFIQFANGGAAPPQFGDLLIFGATNSNPTGHVSVVSGVGPGYVDVVEQNYNNLNPTGHARLPLNGTSMPARSGLPIIGWLRSSTLPRSDIYRGIVDIPHQAAGWTLDGWGGVHPWAAVASGGAMPSTPAISAYFAGWDIARGIGLHPNGGSGYVLDGWGGIHPWAIAGTAMPATPALTAYFPNWDIARGMVMRPDGGSGYVLDGWGGIHPFGGAPGGVAITAYFRGWDIARGIVLRPDGGSGYVLDGWGGVHPWAAAGFAMPPTPAVTGYFPNWDITRGITLRSDGLTGYVLDGWGGVHPFGGVSGMTTTGYWPGLDIARGIAVTTENTGAYVVDGFNVVYNSGTAPPLHN